MNSLLNLIVTRVHEDLHCWFLVLHVQVLFTWSSDYQVIFSLLNDSIYFLWSHLFNNCIIIFTIHSSTAISIVITFLATYIICNNIRTLHCAIRYVFMRSCWRRNVIVFAFAIISDAILEVDNCQSETNSFKGLYILCNIIMKKEMQDYIQYFK